MWSLGCVTVVLLTGCSAFRDPRTHQHSETLAKNCNLTELEGSSEWPEVSARPKAFVGRLLLLEESRRLTAAEALQDPWFNNEFHKTDFEELYRRTIRHWRPRVHKKPVIEFMNAREVKQLPCSQKVLAGERRTRGHAGQTPVDPPVGPPQNFLLASCLVCVVHRSSADKSQYKPFPKQMHQSLFPRRRASGAMYRMSDEVKASIREHWTSSSSSDESSNADTPTHANTIQSLQPRKLPSEALEQCPPPAPIAGRAATQANLTSVKNRSDERQFSRGGFTRTNLRRNKTATSGTSQLEHNRPATPRPEVGDSNHPFPLRALSRPGLNGILQSPETRRDPQYNSYDDHIGATAPMYRVYSTKDFSHESSQTLAKSSITRKETTSACQNSVPGTVVKTKSGLKLRTAKHSNVQSKLASGSKKRRMSIYDLDVEEEVEEYDTEPKRQQLLWQTAAKAFDKKSGGRAMESRVELDTTLVPRTPSPVGSKGSVYLLRL